MVKLSFIIVAAIEAIWTVGWLVVYLFFSATCDANAGECEGNWVFFIMWVAPQILLVPLLVALGAASRMRNEQDD